MSSLVASPAAGGLAGRSRYALSHLDARERKPARQSGPGNEYRDYVERTVPDAGAYMGTQATAKVYQPILHAKS